MKPSDYAVRGPEIGYELIQIAHSNAKGMTPSTRNRLHSFGVELGNTGPCNCGLAQPKGGSPTPAHHADGSDAR